MADCDCGPKPSPVLERAAYERWLACKRYFDEDENLGEHEWRKKKEPVQDNEENSGSSINDKK